MPAIEPGEPYLVKDIKTGLLEPERGPDRITAAGGRVFYLDDDGVHGQELWVSDGTPEKTFMVKDIRPGPVGASLESLTAIGSRLFFTAYDEHGKELWVSDGTPEGTSMLKDIRPGPEGSDPWGLTVLGGRLFFWADDGEHGRELGALPLLGIPRFHRGDCNDDGNVDLSDAVRDLRFCFTEMAVPCAVACDTDGDGDPCTGVTDGVRLLMYLFRGGAPPPPPFPECGTVEEQVDCESLPVNCQ